MSWRTIAKSLSAYSASSEKDGGTTGTQNKNQIVPAAGTPTQLVNSSDEKALFEKTLTEELPTLLDIRSDGIYFKDGGTSDSIHELIHHIIDNWNRRATIRCHEGGIEGASRTLRMVLRAYAGVYKVKIKDNHENYPNLALTYKEKKHINRLRKAIYAYHDDAPSKLSFNPIKVLLTISLLSILLFLYDRGFGFDPIINAIQFAAKWTTIGNNNRTIYATSFVVITLFIVGLFLRAISNRGGSINQFAPPTKSEPTTSINSEVEVRARHYQKRGGVYGTAGAARDYEIDEAFWGFNGGLAPIFED